MQQRGYTLLELVVVIAVIGIIAAMALPKISDWQADQDLNAAARELAADIRLLQQLTVNSVGSGTPQMLFLPSGYSTTVSPISINRTFPTTVVVESADQQPALTFSATDGSPTGGGRTIVLKRTNTNTNISRKVIIQTMTGRVRIE